jgi:pimeloyl-ACP methyl ester carboxylesterase
VFTEEVIPCGEIALNCATGPAAGPPLLLLHGVTRRWQDFVSFLPALTLRWQVHGLDFRGHGLSGRAEGRYHVIDYARDVSAFLRFRRHAPVVIYGHSLGALVAVAVAAQSPECVRALVLEDPPAPSLLGDIRATPFHSMFRGMRSLAGRGHSVAEIARALAELRVSTASGDVKLAELRDPTSLRFSAHCLREMDPEVLTPLLDGRWLDGYDTDAVFESITCPVLLLRADPDRGGMLHRGEAEGLARSMTDCTLMDLPGVGHLLHWMATETVLRLTVGFLESL